MNVQEIRSYCLDQPGTEETIKWDDHICFCIGGKMYFVLCPDQSPVTGSFKTTPEDFESLIGREGLTPAPYMAKHHWIHYEGFECLSTAEWKSRISESYSLVLSKLPAKFRKKLSEQ